MSSLLATTYNHAKELPDIVLAILSSQPCSSNIIYARVNERRTQADGHDDDLWIVLWTMDSSQTPPAPSVVFVLSCTNGPFGLHPIFIFTPFLNRFTHDVLRLGALVLAQELLRNISPERVFSVFALDGVADAFANAWNELTGIDVSAASPYYHAYLMSCTRDTILAREPPPLENATFVLRLATDSDVSKVKSMCYRFSATSPPFVLSEENACIEAQLLVQAKQLWVHEVHVNGSEDHDISCMVAVTRVTDTVAAITKVYTNPTWRQKGCAERLTRYVCQRLLMEKDAVVLYVGRGNPAARVYHNVGFRVAHTADGMAESWKEVGFDLAKVQLGHW